MKIRIVKPTASLEKYRQWEKDISSGEYRSFLTVRDVNKIGRRHWIYCEKQKRQVHLLSDGERRMYLVMLYEPSTVAIYEQYAMDLDKSLDIAVELNLIHARNWLTNEAHVMTTDFLVESRENGSDRLKCTGYTFKYWDQIFALDKQGNVIRKFPRTWQKFAIEHEYWRRHNVDYRVVTERDATKAQFWNIQFCEAFRDLDVEHDELETFADAFLLEWSRAPWLKLDELLTLVSQSTSSCMERCKAVFRYLVLYGFLPIDTQQCIRWFRPVQLMSHVNRICSQT